MQIEYFDIDSEVTPLGELMLRRYRAETGETGYEILLDGCFLMASHGSHSERAMAALAHSRLPRPQHNLEILVGGLGAGHTLRAALDLPGVQRVVVAEIGAKVVEWNCLYFAEVNRCAVTDPRVEIRIDDLAKVLEESRDTFDLLLLDVDNGPGWLASTGNAPLYEPDGIELCRAAMRPWGVLAVWSPCPNPVFMRTLAHAFPITEAVDTTAEGKANGEPGSTVYLAVREG